MTRSRLIVASLTIVLAGGCDAPPPVTDGQASVTAPLPAPPTNPAPAVDSRTTTQYFFDVHDHTAEEITALLERARTTHDSLPEHMRHAVSIVLVLHGPDVAFFATDNYPQYRELVDLAANLDTLGYVDLKMCTAAARSRGLEPSGFPPFIEFVPYGPTEISRLKSDGYVRL